MKKYIVLVLSVFLLLPTLVFGADFYVKSDDKVVLGDQFTVTVSLNSNKNINAIEGQVTFPRDLLDVKEIRDGNSIINFWIQKPTADSPGRISFSGITPGGFSGDDKTVLSILFTSKKSGSGVIGMENVKALLHDGNGTGDTVTVYKSDFSITNTGDSKVYETVKDTELPESFKPEVARNPFMFDGLWFVAFATQDKGSGIKSYEIKELKQRLFAFMTQYEEVISPYVLKDQDLNSYVFIKVVDNAGNIRVEQINPHYPLLWYENSSYWTIIIVLTLILVLIKRWKRRTKYLK